ncbi:MAG TPA: TlyA family RNA methyltransferase [Candidatus Saccharimonadales bacterium]|jgi:23S rRNA (cytidine1920-2'-O)/16S rRNA (cytidine1409-2'-O)-methyltransferase
MKQRLDQALDGRGLVRSRSQAESYIKLGQVKVNGRIVTKPGELVRDDDTLEVTATEQYVSRAALKLASVSELLKIRFEGATILDVGSSTGGFTDYALKHGAVRSIAVEVGTDQLHPSLHGNPAIELHEQTDIRDFKTDQKIDIVVADVSFISLREILPSVAKLCNPQTAIIAMVKPQFEAGQSSLKHKGVIKNDRMRRDILKDFELWAQQHFRIIDKADSDISGSRGNVERFYRLQKLPR